MCYKLIYAILSILRHKNTLVVALAFFFALKGISVTTTWNLDVVCRGRNKFSREFNLKDIAPVYEA